MTACEVGDGLIGRTEPGVEMAERQHDDIGSDALPRRRVVDRQGVAGRAVLITAEPTEELRPPPPQARGKVERFYTPLKR